MTGADVLRRAWTRWGLRLGAAWGRPIAAHGHAMDPVMSALVRFVRRLPPPGSAGGAGAMERQYEAMLAVTALRPAPGVDVRDVAVPGLAGAARLHAPPGRARGTLLYFHGGGFIMGSPRTHEGLCRYLCARTGLRVLAVPYRLAPAHPFPAAHEDARTALLWARNALPGPLAVGGDSAGANLAAGLALRGGAAAQLLLYPVVDMDGAPGDYPSMAQFGEGYLLTAKALEQCKALAFPDGAGDPRASPLLADLRGAAPAVLSIPVFDPLADQGRAYAAALRQAGVAAELLEEGLVHGFADFAGVVPAARRAVDRAADALVRLMEPVHAE